MEDRRIKIIHLPSAIGNRVGWYSNKMRGQRARRAGHVRGATSDAPEPPTRTSAHWQRLIRKVYEADPLLCPDCGGAMRVVSLVDSPMLIEGTLRGMGLWDPPPSHGIFDG